MNDRTDARVLASVSIPDSNVNDSVRCPICEGLHPIRLDRRGNPYVTLSCVGAGSNIFPRTPFGKESFAKWKKAASDDTVSVAVTIPVGESAEPRVLPQIDEGKSAPSVTPLETATGRFLEKRRPRPS